MSAFLVALKYLLIFVAAFFVLVGGALGFFWAAEKYKWGWIEVPVHYRFSFEVEVDGAVYSGSSVVQVTYQRVPQWQMLSLPTDSALYVGQAAIVALPDGKAVCLLLSGKLFGKRHYSVPDIANRVITSEGPEKVRDWERLRISVDTAAGVSGSAGIPFELLPVMIVLDDKTEPRTAHIFDPQHPERTLGVGARFIGAQIAVTHDPVSTDIEKVLPWVGDPYWRFTEREDPFTQENHGQPLFKSDFIQN
jgi:hypothetical protein